MTNINIRRLILYGEGLKAVYGDGRLILMMLNLLAIATLPRFIAIVHKGWVVFCWVDAIAPGRALCWRHAPTMLCSCRHVVCSVCSETCLARILQLDSHSGSIHELSKRNVRISIYNFILREIRYGHNGKNSFASFFIFCSFLTSKLTGTLVGVFFTKSLQTV